MLEQLENLQQEMVDIRRHLHENPELSFTEEKTPAYIAGYLKNLENVDITTGVGGRGVVAAIKGKKTGKTVALRADFDALPIEEANDVPYKSRVSGVMHACGHDAHTASLLGVAKVLSQNTGAFSGEVRLLFQHAEELLPGGAIDMVKAGCLEGVDAVFGSHVASEMPVGQYGFRSGPVMANADMFRLHIQGKGGHGAAPHQCIDPVILMANIIQYYQSIVTRRVDPLKSAVLSVCIAQAGTSAMNVIPDTALVSGTVRTYDNAVQESIIKDMERIAKGVCDAAGASCSLEYIKGYPAVINGANETILVKNSLSKIVDAKDVLEIQPKMGGEDFAHYLGKVPGSFFFTGCGNIEKGITYPHHHPRFDLDERSLLYSSKGLLSVALDYLAS